MKKSCEFCKASNYGSGGFIIYVCNMGYEIDKIKGKPLVECPKPITNKRMFELKELQNKYNLTNDELTRWKL